MKTIHQYYVYILASKIHEALYIGVLNNLQRRVYGHKMKIKKGFTKKYGVSRLVYFETFQNIVEAIVEKRIW